MNFENFNFKPFIYRALKELGFREPTKIQKEIIPLIKDKKNVIGQSETGSGKTHAFLLPILDDCEPGLNQTQVVITSPTRELAKQIYDMATQINEHNEKKFKIKLYVGGKDREKDLAWLQENLPDIVIGTPGRVWDMAIKEKKLLIHLTKYFIVDEADMALESGFLTEIDNIAGVMPDDLQMCVFSATIPEGLKPFLKKYLDNPEYINLTSENVVPKESKHYLIPTRNRDKQSLVIKIMKAINPYLAIIFTNTKVEATELALFLREKGYDVGEIHGDLSSRDRARMMREIRDLRYTYVVATDIAARGIDIEGVSHIINYSLPNDYEFYIHRAGRTSRNNLSGEIYSLYERENNEYLNKLEKRQIFFSYVDIKKGEFVEIRNRNSRKHFVEKVKHEETNKKKAKSKKRVKPNYKRKQRGLPKERRKRK